MWILFQDRKFGRVILFFFLFFFSLFNYLDFLRETFLLSNLPVVGILYLVL